MKIVAKTLPGLEGVLAEELRDFGFENIEEITRGVKAEGDKKQLYRANISCRTALKILVPLKSFEANNEDELYQNAKKIDWESYLDATDTFSIDFSVFSKKFTHSQYAALKVKDALVDRYREQKGIRPSVERRDPTIRFNLHISGNQVNISLDSSGESLNRRGYRKGSIHGAPLNEVLAAGMVMISDWNGRGTFADLFCGSGTILIEAAWYAANISPNLERKNFGFTKWKNYDPRLYNDVVAEAIESEVKSDVKYIGVDIDFGAINQAKINIKSAGLNEEDFILKTASFDQFSPEDKTGIMISNPPYGERLDPENLEEIYANLGTHMKHQMNGWDAWIISGSMEGLKSIGLKPFKKVPTVNAKIPCKIQGYHLFVGKRKEQ